MSSPRDAFDRLYALLDPLRGEEVFFFQTGLGQDYPSGSFSTRLAWGKKDEILPGPHFFERVEARKGEWLVGYWGYDLKNQVEELTSLNPDGKHFPDGYFFVPQFVQEWVWNQPETWPKQAQEVHAPTPGLRYARMESSTSAERYRQQVERIRQYIYEGEVYELNYCLEYRLHEVEGDPIALFVELLRQNPMPFSCLLKVGELYLLCASPERFLRHEQGRLLSQPIKGTAPRQSDAHADQASAQALRQSEKDQAENRMIVDLVRNDLSRSCQPGSVQVPELFGLYSFPRVHQLISSVEGSLRPDVSPIQALKAAFPMGSMTGAPKVRALKLIEELEDFRRGVFSGAAGMMGPKGDYDFNVIIRSLFWNERSKTLSFTAGGAITWDSDADQEWAEVQTKTAGIRQLLGLSA